MVQSSARLDAFSKLFFIIGCMALLSPLFMKNGGAIDFFNHAWLGALYKSSFFQSGAFPLLINTDDVLGDAMPLFYGGFTHALIAMPAFLLDTVLAAKLAMGLTLAASVAFIYTYLTDYGSEDSASNLTLAFLFAICDYFLSNLYSRGALTEFVSINLLVFSLVYFYRYKQQKSTFNLFSAVALIFAAVAAHPLSILFVMIGAVAWLAFDRERVSTLRSVASSWPCATLLIAMIVLLMPIVLFSDYTHLLRSQIVKYPFSTLVKYPFDTILQRLVPGMLDGRMFPSVSLGKHFSGERFIEMSSQFLSGVVNIAAVAIACSMVRTRYRLPLGLILVAAILLSTGQLPGFGYAPSIFQTMQFFYRYNSLIQLILLTVFLHSVYRHRGFSITAKPLFAGVCLGVFCLSMAIKISNTFVLYDTVKIFDTQDGAKNFKTFNRYFPLFYGKGYYQRMNPEGQPDDRVCASTESRTPLRFWLADLDKVRPLSLPVCNTGQCSTCLTSNVLSNPVLRIDIRSEDGRLWENYNYRDQANIFVGYPPNAKLSVRVFTPRPWLAYQFFKTLSLLLLAGFVYYLMFANIARVFVRPRKQRMTPTAC